MSTAKIDTSAVLTLAAERAPLWLRYDDQNQPQPAYLQLNENGVVTAGGDPNIGGGMPMNVAMGRALRWRIPGALTGEQLSDLITDERVVALLERVHAGHDVEWDGSNHRGRLTEDARDAETALERLCTELQGDAQVWDVEAWLGPASIEQLWPAGVELEQAVADLEANAEADGILLTGNLEQALQARRSAETVEA